MSNAYTIVGDAISAGDATEPSLCRVAGTIKNVLGQPVVGIPFTVVHIYSPLTVATDVLVMRERYDVQSDSDGAVSFDAIRGATVRIEVRNRHDLFFEVEIPDQASIDLIDLILPYCVTAAFVDTSPLTVEHGERFSVATEGVFSDGQTRSLSAAAELTSSNETIVAKDSTNYFRAANVGSAEISLDSINEDLLDLYQEPDGDTIVRLSVPATTLPTPLTVNVV
jgi:hypothetical protein